MNEPRCDFAVGLAKSNWIVLSVNGYSINVHPSSAKLLADLLYDLAEHCEKNTDTEQA